MLCIHGLWNIEWNFIPCLYLELNWTELWYYTIWHGAILAGRETNVDDFFGFMLCDPDIHHRVWLTAVNTIKIPINTSALYSDSEILFSVDVQSSFSDINKEMNVAYRSDVYSLAAHLSYYSCHVWLLISVAVTFYKCVSKYTCFVFYGNIQHMHSWMIWALK